MTVMLRSEGIPARFVTGYSVGDKIPEEDIYLVRDKHSHAWVEIFFPKYGWIPFEPTPGATIPLATKPLAAPKLIQFKFINYVPQYVLYILLLGGGED